VHCRVLLPVLYGRRNAVGVPGWLLLRRGAVVGRHEPVSCRQVVRGRPDVRRTRELRGVLCGLVLCGCQYGGPDESVRGGLRVRIADNCKYAAGGVPCGLLLPRRVRGGHAVPG